MLGGTWTPMLSKDNMNYVGSWNRYILDNVMLTTAIHKNLHRYYKILSAMFSSIVKKKNKMREGFKKQL